MAGKNKVIKIRCDEDVKKQWLELCREIDTDADYAEIVEMLHHYLSEKQKFDAVKRASEGPKFR